MEREAFRQRMQQYKQARESNPQLKYWDWKKYADGGEVKDNTYVAPMHKEQIFIPASGAQKMLNDYQYKYGSKSPYKGGELEIVSPEFDILTGVRGLLNSPSKINTLTKELNKNIDISTLNNQLPNNIGWGPKQSIKVIHDSNYNTPLNLYNANRWDVVYEGANPHGIWFQGKFGNPRTTANTSIPGKSEKAAKARKLFEERPYRHKGELVLEKPLVTVGDVPDRSFLSHFGDKTGADGIIYNNVYDNGYSNNQVILAFKRLNDYSIINKYADGGTIEEDPPTTSERPIINFNPKGNPYEAKYGYNPGAGFTRDPFSLYDAPIIGDALSIYDASEALKNKDWLGASLAALGVVPFVPSNLGRTINKSMNNYIPEVRRTAQDKINALLRRENKLNDSLGKTVDGVGLRRVPYEDALNARNRVYESVIDPENLKRARAIDSRYGTSYEAVYKGMSEKYQDPMEYFMHSYEPVLDTNLGSNTKAQVSSNPNNKSIRFSKGVNTGDYNIDTGLIRHEIGHKVDIDATRGAVNTNPFMQDLAKDILPYDQARYMLYGIENPVESYKYLTTPTEIKSHMNQFRQYLIDNKIMKPGDKVDDVPNFFMHLQAAPDEYKGIKLSQNLFKNDRAFKKRFDQIPLTNINDNRVVA